MSALEMLFWTLLGGAAFLFLIAAVMLLFGVVLLFIQYLKRRSPWQRRNT